MRMMFLTLKLSRGATSGSSPLSSCRTICWMILSKSCQCCRLPPPRLSVCGVNSKSKLGLWRKVHFIYDLFLGIMPTETSVFSNEWMMQRSLIPGYDHFKEHYPTYSMVTGPKIKDHNLYLNVFCDQNLRFFTNTSSVWLIPTTINKIP